jgi:hypothetical protein
MTNKVCNRCGTGTEFYASVNQPCKSCVRKQVDAWAFSVDPISGLNNRQQMWLRHRDKIIPQMKVSRETFRLQALSAYSAGNPHCACCGESVLEFLSIDHINNDGALHRRQLGNKNLYRWLAENHYPAGFQVLCYNCNRGKIYNGVCPHKRLEVRYDVA